MYVKFKQDHEGANIEITDGSIHIFFFTTKGVLINISQICLYTLHKIFTLETPHIGYRNANFFFLV
jgi:hypothetical protein